MPITSGILAIIHGVLAVLFGILEFLLIPWAKSMGSPVPWYGYILISLIIITGIFAIVGGLCNMVRKVWLLALTGTIAAFLLTLWSSEYWINLDHYGLSLNTFRGFAGIPAIIAIILTILSRKQFKKKQISD